LFSFIGGVGSI